MTESTRTLKTLELVGGALCLDFVNTINSRVNPVHDYLTEYSDLVGWAKKVEILSPGQTCRLQKRAKQSTADAEAALGKSRMLRELLFRLFSNAARESRQRQQDIEKFLLEYGKTIAESHLQKKNNHYTLSWSVDKELDGLLNPIIHSGGELLLYGDLAHLKECPGCGWLFLDTSKNQSRRWCSMNTCGARDKMRRYHKRKHRK